MISDIIDSKGIVDGMFEKVCHLCDEVCLGDYMESADCLIGEYGYITCCGCMDMEDLPEPESIQ